MGTIRTPQNSLYGTPNGLQGNLHPNIITKRDPTAEDTGYYFGQIWVNTADGNAFVLTQVSAGLASWEAIGGGSVILESLTGNSGGAIDPVAGNINVLGGLGINTVGTTGTITVDNTGVVQLMGNTGGAISPTSGGIVDVVGSGNITTSGFGNSIVITDPSYVDNQVTTTNATPTTIFALNLGGTPATWAINVDVLALNKTTTDGAAFTLFALMVTNGTSATEVQSEVGINLQGSTLMSTEVTVSASGNDVIVQVTGVTSTTIDWSMIGNLREVD